MSPVATSALDCKPLTLVLPLPLLLDAVIVGSTNTANTQDVNAFSFIVDDEVAFSRCLLCCGFVFYGRFLLWGMSASKTYLCGNPMGPVRSGSQGRIIHLIPARKHLNLYHFIYRMSYLLAYIWQSYDLSIQEA
jgi:hypothetical protein